MDEKPFLYPVPLVALPDWQLEQLVRMLREMIREEIHSAREVPCPVCRGLHG